MFDRFKSSKDGVSSREVMAFSKAIIAYTKANAAAEIAAKDVEIARLSAELDEARRQHRIYAYVTSWAAMPKDPENMTAAGAAATQWLADEIRKIKTDAEERRILEGDDE